MNINLSYIIYIFFFNFKFIFSLKNLNKHESVEVDCNLFNFIVFDSSDFPIPSSIYFKFTTDSEFITTISFEFFDYINPNNIQRYNDSRFALFPSGESFEMINNVNHSIYYYIVEKNKDHVDKGKGKNLVLNFQCDGMLIIENTENDLSNSGLSTGTIVGIVGGCLGFVGIIIFIIVYRYKYKKNLNNSIKKEKDQKKKKFRKKKLRRMTKEGPMQTIRYKNGSNQISPSIIRDNRIKARQRSDRGLISNTNGSDNARGTKGISSQ